MPSELPSPSGDFVLYQTEDGQTRLQVRLQEETVWLTQAQMADLFQTTTPNINLHLRNLYEEGELSQASTIKQYLIVRQEGARQVSRTALHYNLDVIISVGYRVKSHRGRQFRIWATQRLREFIVKGFTLDDEKLKQAGGGDYFDELLGRIRDIRSSEKVFWRKVLDIYATSVDYNSNTEASQAFFATIQNKMHWGAHGHTAAEVVRARADAKKPNMGLTAWTGSRPRKTDLAVAKNYLGIEEIEALNLIVSMYLDFAELKARGRKPMHMRDWIAKLDDFLRISDREILSHGGRVSHTDALRLAEAEYEKWHQQALNGPTQVEKDFDEAVEKIKKLGSPKKKRE